MKLWPIPRREKSISARILPCKAQRRKIPPMRIALQQNALHSGFPPGLMRQTAVVRLGADRLAEFLRDEISRNPFLECGLPPPQNPAVPDDSQTNLRAHLLAQSRMIPMPPRRRRLTEALIDFIDERGRLDLNPADFADLAPGTPGRRRLDDALKVLHDLDPAGAGARDLRECLLIQINRKISEDGENPALLAARGIAQSEEQLRFFLRRRWDKLPKPHLAEAAKILEKLHPEPGAAFAPSADAAAPDIVFAKRRGLWKAEAGAGLDFSPRTIRRRTQAGENWLRERAAELVFAVTARKRLTLKLAQWAADRQREFLESGAEALSPLTMEDAGRALECTTGMISHIARDKRCVSPRGAFALKFLFPRPAAGRASAAAIAQRIRRLISAENPDSPLTDEALREKLRGEGVALARRTVMKHRKSAGISPSGARRRIRAKKE